MQKYQAFIIDSYELDSATREIRLHYSLDDSIFFTETFRLPPELPLPETLSPALERLLGALHIAVGVSYWKAACTPRIEVRTSELGPASAAFWTEVYEKGLGEFFYQNQIDFRGLVQFVVTGADLPEQEPKQSAKSALVPVGGGKDSAVTIELLREANVPVTLLRVGGHPLIDAFVAEAKLPCLTVERVISEKLLELNAAGAPNGHVPVTAIVSILALVVAEMRGDGAVVMSNESSANEENVDYLGMAVNHQWSKSLAFERGLQAELRRASVSTRYFSVLRPLNELQITRLFAQHEHYLDLCTSCNRNWTLTRQRPNEKWCGTCPKCAFVFLLLAAFIDKPPLIEAFGGKNPLDDPALLPLYRELLGIAGHKPFECVGTPAETIAAFLLAQERGQWDDAAVMRMFATDVMPHLRDPHGAVDAALEAHAEHAIPSAFLTSLHAPR